MSVCGLGSVVGLFSLSDGSANPDVIESFGLLWFGFASSTMSGRLVVS
jgi:hypothetical protein